MDIITYKGLQEEVFCTIGKYSMDATIIKKLGNPITTDKDSVWVIGSFKGQLVGFCRLNISKTKNKISNVLILDNSEDSFKKIVKAAIVQGDKTLEVLSYADNDNLKYFENLGFKVQKKGVNWHTIVKEVK